MLSRNEAVQDFLMHFGFMPRGHETFNQNLFDGSFFKFELHLKHNGNENCQKILVVFHKMGNSQQGSAIEFYNFQNKQKIDKI